MSEQIGATYALVVHNGDLLDAAVPRELVVEVTLCRANAEAEDTQDIRRVRVLRVSRVNTVMWRRVDEQRQLTAGACGGRRGAGDGRLERYSGER